MAISGKHRVVLITGAGGGIGRAIATRFREQGDELALADVSDKRVEELTATYPESTVFKMDVTNPLSVSECIGVVEETAGRLDVLVNNAGILTPNRVLDITLAEWNVVLSVNLTGAFICSKAAHHLLSRSAFGRIVNMSSSAGKSTSTVGGAHYTAAKAGLLGLTRHMAREFGGSGITVNAVCPGLIDTEMVSAVIDAEATAAYAHSFPISRLGNPAEVADVVAFLASDRAGYITGASIDINGGDLTI